MSTKPKKPVEVVVFNNPESWKRKKGTGNSDAATSTTQQMTTGGKNNKKFNKFNNYNKNKPNDNSPSPGFVYDQKQAKYDVRKLAIRNMKKTEKDNAMVDFLVELGAKRPKNKCLHPQEYVEQLKRKREEEKEEDQRAGIKKKRQRKRNRRDKDDLLSFVDGQKGWYKDGVQYVDSK